jgi:hypothetical protein
MQAAFLTFGGGKVMTKFVPEKFSMRNGYRVVCWAKVSYELLAKFPFYCRLSNTTEWTGAEGQPALPIA